MLPPVPDLAAYGLTPDTGFLPSQPPLRKLPSAYDAWENLVVDLQPLILTKRLRTAVESLSVLSTDQLRSDAEWRRAYVVLVFLLHAYVWGENVPAERIPPPLSTPLLKVSEHLELPPVATYAGVVLWNYRPVFPDEPADDLSNLATLNTFTGSLDEQWFYLVSVAMEARGAPALPLMLDAISAARNHDVSTVTHCLERFAEIVSELGDLLQEMYSNCSPHAFYHGFRPYLAGSRNMADAGLPRGILYEDNSGNEKYRQYGGGSNAQSSLIQFLDIVLGIEHRPTGEHAPTPSDPNISSSSGGATSGDESGEGPRRRHNFIMDMRSYMPGPHRRFLEHVAAVANIHDFVAAHPDDQSLCTAYNAALAMVHALRQRHIQMVTRYIVVKSRESREQQSQSQQQASADQPHRSRAENNKIVNLSTVKNNPKTAGKKLRGTGGTALIEFLKQARNETGEPAVGAWANRILNNSSWQTARRSSSVSGAATDSARTTATAPAPAVGDRVATLPTLGEHADGQVEVVGLAGSWSLDQSEGGLCHW